MNKQEITKQYSIIFICLALVSMLIMFATPFITAFEMNLGLVSGSETGMDYISNLLELDGSNKKNSSSSGGWLDELEDKYSNYTIIEETARS